MPKSPFHVDDVSDLTMTSPSMAFLKNAIEASVYPSKCFVRTKWRLSAVVLGIIGMHTLCHTTLQLQIDD